MTEASTNGFLYEPSILDKIKLEDWPKTEFKTAISITTPGEGLKMRPLHRDDHQKGFLTNLAQLTAVGDISEKEFHDAFDKMKATPNTYYVTVIEDLNKGVIIGSATLLMEQKFIHNCGKRGRIEDVVVSDEYRGKQLGKILLTALVSLSKHLDCYKISLDCRDQMIPFYETLGFVKEPNNGNFMVIRF
ncbi:putative glucosamine 6-phosphate N-acetyltransferase [Orchesella cincta]|uniref:Glucosamine 6-phosphate N-acetyltransferase n=1 Tax=Orchesella cincta TaxID=48709 RepID=A0A1D2NAQ1_ORCCI|nr:putative glucosamine 6-phosphate N-acetyltransferase [Orchesella cincta]